MVDNRKYWESSSRRHGVITEHSGHRMVGRQDQGSVCVQQMATHDSHVSYGDGALERRRLLCGLD